MVNIELNSEFSNNITGLSQCSRYRLNPWAGKSPWKRKWQLIPVFLPGKSNRRAWWTIVHGATKESDTV